MLTCYIISGLFFLLVINNTPSIPSVFKLLTDKTCYVVLICDRGQSIEFKPVFIPTVLHVNKRV